MVSRLRPFAALLAVSCLAVGSQGCGKSNAPEAAAAAPGQQSTAAPASGQNALSGPVGQMARAFAGNLGGRTVAVLEFPDLKGQGSELGNLVSEQLTTELVKAISGNGKVLERRQVIQVLEELNLRKADLTTSEVELAAQQLGADAIVVGSASVVGGSIEVNARAVNVNGGNLLTADRFSVGADRDLLALATRTSSAGGGSGTVSPGAAPAEVGAPITEATVGPVHAKVNECRAGGSVVTCSLTFTSATVDAEIRINGYGASEARDEGGNAYQFSEFTFGSENGSEWRTLLVAKEQTPGRFIITGVPITMTRFTRVELSTDIQIGERGLNTQSLLFRNVPIVRDAQ